MFALAGGRTRWSSEQTRIVNRAGADYRPGFLILDHRSIMVDGNRGQTPGAFDEHGWGVLGARQQTIEALQVFVLDVEPLPPGARIIGGKTLQAMFQPRDISLNMVTLTNKKLMGLVHRLRL